MKLLAPLAFGLLATAAWAERINHEGRILGPEPVVAAPILFNTPEADAIVSAMQIMPVTSPWNEDISQRPLLANSAAMIAKINSELTTTPRTLRPFFEMNYALVPDSQPTLPIRFFNYADESDLDGGTSPNGLYPIPPLLPVEGWPKQTGNLTNDQWQRDMNNTGGDRHSIIVKPGAGFIWETWLTKRVGTAWEASNGAKFNLGSNALRPATWTSADAAGLPMFPALVRYDECERGLVEHALRLILKHTRKGPIYPATHQASAPPTDDPNVPAMGQRVRLKASFTIPANWTKQEKAVLLAFKKYGALVADNGNFFSISVCPDQRFPAGCFDHLSSIGIDNFEVVQTTGPNEGPRSPGAPSADAGPDRWMKNGETLSLGAAVTAPGGPATILWKKYAGPGTVTFANPASASTTATFSVAGDYTLLLSASDGLHAVAYDAVNVRVELPVGLSFSDDDVIVSFPTALGHLYRVEHSGNLAPDSWGILADQLAGTGNPRFVPHTGAAALPQGFYRVLVN